MSEPTQPDAQQPTPKPLICPNCNGSGEAWNGTHTVECAQCFGDGKIEACDFKAGEILKLYLNRALSRLSSDSRSHDPTWIETLRHAIKEVEQLSAHVETLERENNELKFQSSLNDTDMPDAELVAALFDMMLEVTDDADNGISGTILSKTKAAIDGLMENTALRASRDEARKQADELSDLIGQCNWILGNQHKGRFIDMVRDMVQQRDTAIRERDEVRATFDAHKALCADCAELAQLRAKVAELHGVVLLLQQLCDSGNDPTTEQHERITAAMTKEEV